MIENGKKLIVDLIKEKAGNFKPIVSVKRIDIYALCLLLLTAVLCLTNYTTGTWLSGWDTLHPEFNFGLYFQRIFFSVWQEHQGLGAVASQSHAAELPRILLYYPLSFVLPASFLRYAYFFLTLIIGTLGTYYFLKKVIFKNVGQIHASPVSFTGALIYLLNLGTLQHYYVPLEMFAYHFATLPWVFLFTTKYIEVGSFKNLLQVLALAFFVAPIAHTATLFYVFFGLVFIYWSLLALLSVKAFRRVLVVALSFLLLNSYWLLPNVYYVINHGQGVASSQIHTQFSEKAFLTGKKFGGIVNTTFLKSFLFDWGEYDKKTGKFVDLFDEWQPHLSGFFPFLVGYLVFVLVILGVVNSVARKYEQRKYALALLPIGLVSFFFIANNNLLSQGLFGLFEEFLPVIKEALRFPFTKFSIILAFCYGVFVSLALYYLGMFVKRYLRIGDNFFPLLSVAFTALLVFYMLPAFQGNLISKSMKVSVPQEYFKLFKWSETQEKNTRIAAFPMDTFWGWVYYDWSYEGAGFRWFGLGQSVLDREFDRWYPYNENFYWEASYALYAKNYSLLEKVIEKYQVNWILIDGSVINPWSPKSLYIEELKSFLSSSDKFSLEKEIEKLKVYKVNLDTPVSNYVFLVNNPVSIGYGDKWNNYDRAYFDNGIYVQGDSQSNYYYPFRSLFTGKQERANFVVKDLGDSYLFESSFPKEIVDWELEVASWEAPELVFVNNEDLRNTEVFTSEIRINDTKLTVKFPKVGGLYSALIDPVVALNSVQAKSCNNKTGGKVENQIILEDESMVHRLIAADAINCSAAFWFERLPHDLSYLISVESKNVKGMTLLFWLENLNIHKSDQETYLSSDGNWQTSYFIQPPMEEDGAGYALHFDNISIGQDETINDLGRITIYPFPYKLLTSMYLHPEDQNVPSQQLFPVEVTHSSPSLYQVAIQQSDNPLASEAGVAIDSNSVLVLSQAYSSGWRAYKGSFGYLSPIFGKEIKDHVLVNNWENGWRIDSDSNKITIVFWPQYLQFLGYFLAVGFIVVIVVFRKKLFEQDSNTTR